MKSSGIFREKYKVFRGISSFIKRYKGAFVLLLFFEVLILLSQLAGPVLYKLFIDEVLMRKNISILKWICIGQLGLFLLHTAFIYFGRLLKFKSTNIVLMQIKGSIFKRFMGMSPKKLDKIKAGELEQVINMDISTMEKFISIQMIDYLISIGFVVFSAGILLFIDWRLTLISCVIIPIPYIAGYYIGKINYKRQMKRRVLYGEYESFMHDSLQAWKEIKALNLQKNQLRRFINFRHRIAVYDIISGYWEYLRQMISFVNEVLATKVLLYFIGGLFVMRGNITIGSLLVFISYYGSFYSRINEINKNNYEFYNDLPSLKRVIENLEMEDDNKNKRLIRKPLSGSIEFKEVSFKYEESQVFSLNNINFTIQRGEKTAIVGRSGSGKTTIIKLLLGMYTPDKGEIYLDNYSLSSLHTRELHQNIGVVMQDSMLFNMSIKDNLLLSQSKASDEDIIKACKMAYIHDFIESLPEKYETIIGEKGVKLSGGQRQRLAIARLLLKTPDTVVFDEATSSLDHESETAIHEALEAISNNRTIIIIAHRLSSVLLADKVLVVDNGELIAVGKHSELINNNEVYKKLFKEQFEGIS